MASKSSATNKQGPSSGDRQAKGDPTHHEETMAIAKQAYNELPPLGKVMMTLSAIYFVLVIALPDMFLYKLGIRSNKRYFRLKRVTTSPPVFQGEYLMPAQSSNCVVIKGKDGKLLIRSPPQPLPEVIAQITQEGEPGAIIVSSGHDTYADKWKELFPNIKVLGMKNEIPILNNRVKVDLAVEDAGEFLKNYHVVQIISDSEYLRLDEFTMLIQLDDGSIVASLGCGMIHRANSSWLNPLDWRLLLGGGSGFRMIRIFELTFVKDQALARKAWRELAQTPNLRGLIFLHGDPLIGFDVPQKMLKADLGWSFQ